MRALSIDIYGPIIVRFQNGNKIEDFLNLKVLKCKLSSETMFKNQAGNVEINVRISRFVKTESTWNFRSMAISTQGTKSKIFNLRNRPQVESFRFEPRLKDSSL